MKKSIKLIMLITLVVCVLGGCKKKEPVDTGPVDAQLTAVTANELQPGCFYVKTLSGFYKLPIEHGNFDTSKEYSVKEGMIKPTDNRIVSFTWTDNAIPTLYQNDQLVYVSDNVGAFTWERFKDLGYSIGASGLLLSDAGKIYYDNATSVPARMSSFASCLDSLGLAEDSTVIINSVNGTELDETYYSDGGVVSGFSKDMTVNVDLYQGTTPSPQTCSADTRYFKSFEIYGSDSYSLSPDGYALVDIPKYMMSGYYFINNVGFVKYVKANRGDDVNVDLSTPYFYLSKDNELLTYYEYLGRNGADAQMTQALTEEEPMETFDVALDATQKAITVNVFYNYVTQKAENDAKKMGSFPRVTLKSPKNEEYILEAKESNSDKKLLTCNVTGAMAGDWTLSFYNFEDIQKNVQTSIASGNANSFLVSGSSGSIKIYYEASERAHDFVITWEDAMKMADITITDPQGVKYSKSITPGYVMENTGGKFIMKLPNLIEGNYTIEVKGQALGRVWVETEASVNLNTMPGSGLEDGSVFYSEGTEGETFVGGESEPSAPEPETPVAAEAETAAE